MPATKKIRNLKKKKVHSSVKKSMSRKHGKKNSRHKGKGKKYRRKSKGGSGTQAALAVAGQARDTVYQGKRTSPEKLEERREERREEARIKNARREKIQAEFQKKFEKQIALRKRLKECQTQDKDKAIKSCLEELNLIPYIEINETEKKALKKMYKYVNYCIFKLEYKILLRKLSKLKSEHELREKLPWQITDIPEYDIRRYEHKDGKDIKETDEFYREFFESLEQLKTTSKELKDKWEPIPKITPQKEFGSTLGKISRGFGFFGRPKQSVNQQNQQEEKSEQSESYKEKLKKRVQKLTEEEQEDLKTEEELEEIIDNYHSPDEENTQNGFYEAKQKIEELLKLSGSEENFNENLLVERIQDFCKEFNSLSDSKNKEIDPHLVDDVVENLKILCSSKLITDRQKLGEYSLRWDIAYGPTTSEQFLTQFLKNNYSVEINATFQGNYHGESTLKKRLGVFSHRESNYDWLFSPKGYPPLSYFEMWFMKDDSRFFYPRELDDVALTFKQAFDKSYKAIKDGNKEYIFAKYEFDKWFDEFKERQDEKTDDAVKIEEQLFRQSQNSEDGYIDVSGVNLSE